MMITFIVALSLVCALASGDDGLNVRALSFGRTRADYIQFQPGDMSPFSTSFTICSWMKRLHDASAPIVFHYFPGQFIIGDNGYWNYVINKHLYLGGKFPEANQWFHHCLSWVVGGTQRVYVNGVQLGSTSASGSSLPMGGTITLGNCVHRKTTNWVFGGQLHKLNWYSEELTSSQIREMFEAGLCSTVEEAYSSREIKWELILRKQRYGNVTEFLPTECATHEVDCKTKLEETEVKLATIEKKLQEVTATLNDTLSETQTKGKESETKLQETQAALEESETQHQGTKTELTESRHQHQGTKSELTESRNQHQRTKTELTELETKLPKTQAALEESETQHQGTKSELTESRHQHQRTKTELTELETKLQKTQAALEESETQHQGTKSELTESRHQHQGTKTELTELETKLQKTQAALEKSESQHQETKNELTESRHQHQGTKTELCKKLSKKLSKKLKQKENKLIKTDQELQEIAKTLNDTKIELLGTQVDLEELKMELQETGAKLNSTKQELQENTTTQNGTLLEEARSFETVSKWDVLFTPPYLNKLFTRQLYSQLTNWVMMGKSFLLFSVVVFVFPRKYIFINNCFIFS